MFVAASRDFFFLGFWHMILNIIKHHITFQRTQILKARVKMEKLQPKTTYIKFGNIST